MLFGYARVSTADQNPDHQIDALLRAGVDRDNIHIDTASGAKSSRPKLDLVMQLLRGGDTVQVTRLDRLSRSVLHLVTLGADLRERGIGLHVIEQGIDTQTVEGRAMFGMLSVLAELQCELIVANTNDGLASARARGRVGGRRPKLTADQAALA
jgi:DNA invertase Pin-like site-specific DNA recombinase